METKKSKLKGVKPRVFKFEKGDYFGMDDEIIFYIAELLCNNINEDEKITQKTYITIQCVKEVSKDE